MTEGAANAASQLPSWVNAALLTMVVYFLRQLHADLKDLAAAFHEFRAEVPESYATKRDLSDHKKECHDDHARIHTRIDEMRAAREKADVQHPRR